MQRMRVLEKNSEKELKKMKKSIRKITAALSAAVIGVLPMAASLTADAALPNDRVKNYYGDVDHNGSVNITDYNQVYYWATHQQYLNSDQRKRADINADGVITTADADKILDYYVKNAAGQKILGDANGNGTVDLNDVLKVQTFCATHSTQSNINLIRADVNADGVMNMCDYKLIYFYVLGKIDSLYVNWGDVDSEGYVTNADAQKLERDIRNNSFSNLSAAERRRADVNIDGKINNDDVAAITFYVSTSYFN